MVINKFIIQLITGPRFYMGGGGSKVSAQDKLYANPQFQMALQAQENQRALDASRYNVEGPQGRTGWNPKTSTYHTILSPEQQKLYESTTQNQNNAADFLASQTGMYQDALRNPISNGGVYSDMADQQAGSLSSVLGEPISGGDMAQRQRIEDALMARLNPSLERDQNALSQSLANQGLAPGSEAYTNAMKDQSRRVNDARLGVIGQGTREMQATQGMDLARRSQAMGESQGLVGLAQNQQQLGNNSRNQVMSERAGLMQQAGNAQIPAYNGAPQQQTPVNISQMLQNYGNNQNNAQQAKQASKNGAMGSGIGALGSIGGAFAGSPLGSAAIGSLFSDRRLKENIVCVGKTKYGLNLYHFNYIRDPHTRYQGVMADEVKEIMPEAVRTGNDSFMSVDYGMLGLKMKEV